MNKDYLNDVNYSDWINDSNKEIKEMLEQEKNTIETIRINQVFINEILKGNKTFEIRKIKHIPKYKIPNKWYSVINEQNEKKMEIKLGKYEIFENVFTNEQKEKIGEKILLSYSKKYALELPYWCLNNFEFIKDYLQGEKSFIAIKIKEIKEIF